MQASISLGSLGTDQSSSFQTVISHTFIGTCPHSLICSGGAESLTAAQLPEDVSPAHLLLLGPPNMPRKTNASEKKVPGFPIRNPGGVPAYLGQGSSGFAKSAAELYRILASGGLFAGEFGAETEAAGLLKQQARIEYSRCPCSACAQRSLDSDEAAITGDGPPAHLAYRRAPSRLLCLVGGLPHVCLADCGVRKGGDQRRLPGRRKVRQRPHPCAEDLVACRRHTTQRGCRGGMAGRPSITIAQQHRPRRPRDGVILFDRNGAS